jgi:hypothetical protein
LSQLSILASYRNTNFLNTKTKMKTFNELLIGSDFSLYIKDANVFRKTGDDTAVLLLTGRIYTIPKLRAVEPKTETVDSPPPDEEPDDVSRAWSGAVALSSDENDIAASIPDTDSTTPADAPSEFDAGGGDFGGAGAGSDF